MSAVMSGKAGVELKKLFFGQGESAKSAAASTPFGKGGGWIVMRPLREGREKIFSESVS